MYTALNINNLPLYREAANTKISWRNKKFLTAWERSLSNEYLKVSTLSTSSLDIRMPYLLSIP